jgi:heterodisulfide reductase subunit C
MGPSGQLATPGETSAKADEPGVAHTAHSASEAPSHKTLVAEILERAGVNVRRCYHCGKCSAGCPMAAEMTSRPHEIRQMVLRDERDELLGGNGIWLCLSCETCSARCPNAADPARVIDALREIALEQDPALAPRAVGAFNRSFLDQIKGSGRMFEVGLAAQYNQRSGHLMQDAGSVPALFSRGKLKIKAAAVRDVGDVRRIFANVEAAQRSAKKTGGNR